MGSKLSHKLLDIGFFSALGTSEEEVHVGRRTPNTYDSNNGVTVVYDEEGRPWIVRNDHLDGVMEKFQIVIAEHSLKRGAYVPHSNDGGYFVHEVLPKL